jgi:hypothetical protein
VTAAKTSEEGGIGVHVDTESLDLDAVADLSDELGEIISTEQRQSDPREWYNDAAMDKFTRILSEAVPSVMRLSKGFTATETFGLVPFGRPRYRRCSMPTQSCGH